MSLRRLQIFLEVAARGSFAAAADRLGLAQSAVSMQIRNLEEELGADLFDRSRRPPVLNDRGAVLIPKAREVLALYEDLKHAVRGGVAGTLRLGVIQTASTGILPGALAAQHRLHPEMRVRIESGLSADLISRVAAGELDAAIVTAPHRVPPEMVSHTIVEEPLVVIAPQGSDGNADDVLLARYPFIRFNRRTGVGRIIEQELRRRQIPVDEAMELDSIEPIIGMVSRGLGVAVVPSHAVLPEIRDRLRVLPFGVPQVRRRVSLMERVRSPRAALAEIMVAALRSAAGTG